ncbi:maleylpyruvate isomerase N-terminal domain-containing protein [Amycolatopsis thermoflava]|uniref:maleylpyruvate isomerase N-terminal domain-containing protein n=1 Tax=Amycolatopsis thermoflava TaxID=84480 RepID=UPI0037FF5534
MTSSAELSPELMLGEYLSSANRFLALAREHGDDLGATAVPSCPAWRAKDLLAHVTGIAAHVTSGRDMGPDVQAWIDGEVAARSGRTVGAIVAEWEDALPRLAAALRGQPVGGLVIDVVTHEHDLRGALGAADHEQGLAAVLPALVDHVTELAPLRDGRGVRLLGGTTVCTFGGPEIGLEADVGDEWELFRLLACRRSAEELEAYPRQGDVRLLFDLVSRYPLPERPLGERAR